MTSEVGMLFVPALVVNVSRFVRLIWRTCPDGTVITTGDQTSGFGPAAAGLRGAQVAAGTAFVATAAPQPYPHIGTACPSGKVAVAGPTVRLTCCCAKAAPLPRRRAEVTSAALTSIELTILERIAAPSSYM